MESRKCTGVRGALSKALPWWCKGHEPCGCWGLCLVLGTPGLSMLCFIGFYLVAQNTVCRKKCVYTSVTSMLYWHYAPMYQSWSSRANARDMLEENRLCVIPLGRPCLSLFFFFSWACQGQEEEVFKNVCRIPILRAVLVTFFWGQMPRPTLLYIQEGVQLAQLCFKYFQLPTLPGSYVCWHFCETLASVTSLFCLWGTAVSLLWSLNQWHPTFLLTFSNSSTFLAHW